MNAKKLLLLLTGGMLLVGILAGCSTMAASWGGTFPTGTTSPQTSNSSSSPLNIVAHDESADDIISYEEKFKPYEQFGLIYDTDKNELQYNGKVVRWFEDYYPISVDGAQAGNDFFHENGVVDVYAVRDLNSLVYNEDGSYDPSGKLIGVKEFSEKEFAARDIEAIKNPQPITLISGDRMLTTKELEDMAKEYEAFGVTYEAEENQWYLNGEKVRIFQDVLTSNGESLTNGKFHGTIRTFGSSNGTIDIYAVRDYTKPDASGNGTLTGVEKFSQAEFDEHTQSGKEVQNNSGECVVN